MTTLTMPEVSNTSQAATRLRASAAAVRVHFTWWGTHKTLSDEQKQEVGLSCNADVRLITAGKKLIDVRHEAFRRLTSIRSRASSYWRGLTLPYVEPGTRLIRQSDVEAFVIRMEEFQDDLQMAESALNEVYDELLSDARHRLGNLFNASDYPSEVNGLFGIDWDFPSVEPPNYLLRLCPEVYQQEQRRVAERFEEAVRLAEDAFISEFGKLVTHLTERLSGEENGGRKIFRDTAVTNLMEFFERFRSLNIRSNAQLDDLVEQAQAIVRGVSPGDLRGDGDLREFVATELNKVQTQVDQLIVSRPRRKIIRPQENRQHDNARSA